MLVYEVFNCLSQEFFNSNKLKKEETSNDNIAGNGRIKVKQNIQHLLDPDWYWTLIGKNAHTFASLLCWECKTGILTNKGPIWVCKERIITASPNACHNIPLPEL